MIKINCNQCGATGCYSGLCEGKGIAVICTYCKGTGYHEAAITLDEKARQGSKQAAFVEFAGQKFSIFTGKKRRNDIHTVYRGGGTFILGAGPREAGIAYESFFNGAMPP